MKYTRLVSLTFSCVLLATSVRAQEHAMGFYSTKYDNIDLEAIIKNQRLMKNYVGCLLERNPCTADAAEMRRNLPDALATNCGSCSEAQKRMSDRLSHHLIDHRPEDWRLLEAKYDPTGDYRRRYEKQQLEQQQQQQQQRQGEQQQQQE